MESSDGPGKGLNSVHYSQKTKCKGPIRIWKMAASRVVKNVDYKANTFLVLKVSNK